MNAMKSFLLLIFSLMTGCEAGSDVKGCVGGWIEFTCKYCESEHSCEMISSPKSTSESMESNEMSKISRIFKYPDAKDRNCSLVVKRLTHKDAGEYSCKCKKGKKNAVKLKLTDEDETCPKPFHQTANRTGNTTISCDYPKDDDKPKFFCKETGDARTCKDILSTKSQKQNGRFNLIATNRGLNISISDVSTQDAGVYWCGLESKDNNFRTGLRKIELVFQGLSSTRAPSPPPTSTRAPSPSPTPTPSTSPVPSTQSTMVSSESHGGSEIVIPVVICVAVLLLLVLTSMIIYRRLSCSKNTTNGAAEQHNGEGYVYEEIQEPLQRPNAGKEMTTIYVTANFPSNSETQYYSIISFRNSSNEAGGEAPLPKPIQGSTSTDIQPSSPTQDPLYSTLWST